MEETIDLLAAYYMALLEKRYINHRGRGTPLIKSDHPEYSYFAYLLAAPRWREAGVERMDRECVTRLVENGYYFWVSARDARDTWCWIQYKDGHWTTEADGSVVPENRIQEMIRRSAALLNMKLAYEPASEMSKAARLLDDEMQYEI